MSDPASASPIAEPVATIPAAVGGNVDFLTFDEPVTASGSGVVEPASASAGPIAGEYVTASYDVKAFSGERWMRDREGYRDGGY